VRNPRLIARKIHDKAGRTITHWVRAEQQRHVLRDAALRPQAQPVSAAMEVHHSWVWHSANLGVDRALSAIDKVHRVEGLPRIQVRVEQLRGNGSYESYGSRHFVVRVGGNGEHPSFTAAHEIGHAIDHHIFGDGDANLEHCGSSSGHFRSLMRSIVHSDAVQGLIANSHHALRTNNHANASIASYLLDRRELFARAYSQWIAVRSGDRDMLGQMRSTRSAWASMGWHKQWEDHDFEPIAREMDSLFAARGWLHGRRA